MRIIEMDQHLRASSVQQLVRLIECAREREPRVFTFSVFTIHIRKRWTVFTISLSLSLFFFSGVSFGVYVSRSAIFVSSCSRHIFFHFFPRRRRHLWLMQDSVVYFQLSNGD